MSGPTLNEPSRSERSLPEASTILAGDLGGTKCNLGLFELQGTLLRPVFQRRFPTRDYSAVDELVGNFLRQASTPAITAAGFAVAGAVTEGRHYSENMPWAVEAAALARKLNLANVQLLNDLIATALSLDKLPPQDFVSLNTGTPVANGTRAVIAAGTGLGQALLFWDGAGYRVAPAEAGQADFAPRSEREIQLLLHLRRQLSHVSCEEIVSGRGFRRIHEFLDPALRHDSFEPPAANAAGDITQRGLSRSCPVCVETVEFWTQIFAGAAGNFALQTMALGGIFLAGGIAVKIMSKLQDGAFMQSFYGEGKLAPVLAQVPISIVVNEDAPMFGAAYAALRKLRS